MTFSTEHLRQELAWLYAYDEICYLNGKCKPSILARIKEIRRELRERRYNEFVETKDVLNGQRRITQEETTGKD